MRSPLVRSRIHAHRLSYNAIVRGGAAFAVVILTACDAVFGLHHGDVPGDGGDGDALPPPSSWMSVSTALDHSCGIRLDGTLWCWGRNDVGQLGHATTDLEDDTPTQVGAATWTQISAGDEVTCGLQGDGSLWCWGHNQVGQVGTGDKAAVIATPTQVAGTWSAVSVGFDHVCAIQSDGAIACWGEDNQGQCGDSNLGAVNFQPVGVETGGGRPGAYVAVSAGFEFTCGLATDQTAWCWGQAQQGEVGVPSTNNAVAPVQAGSAADTYTAISTGLDHTCALRPDHHIRCWGGNEAGQLGDDTTTGGPTPVAVGQDLATWASVTASGAHTCAIDTAGALWCWGANLHDELAADTGAETFKSSPNAVSAPGTTWTAAIAGHLDTCAIDAQHQLWCAGLDGGALGEAGGGTRKRPVKVGSNVMKFALGGDSSNFTGTACAIDPQAHLSCWGYNGEGTVGDGTQLDRQVAVPLPMTMTWNAISVGNHACAIDASGALWCWGNNSNGQVGSGNAGNFDLAPVAILAGTTWGAVGVGADSCAVHIPDGSASCWGANNAGQAGNPNTGTDVTTPTPIDSMDQWSFVGAGDTHACGLSSEGVACWGDCSEGQCGSAVSGSFAPTLVALPPGPYDTLAIGGRHNCAGLAGSAFYCWGANESGQLGDQTVMTRGIPELLQGTWLAIAAGEDHTCGVAMDHTLACWGLNQFGQLGDGTVLDHHEPKPVGSDTDWATVYAGPVDTCALKINGDLYCWGRDTEGEVGDGTAWRAALVVVR